jgi:catechol 2,3-dioxygenase-like lactoylglutathione lyase family enzyme
VSAGVQALLRVGRNVADLERACAFYCEALGFNVVDRGAPPWTRLPGVCDEVPRSACLKLGEQEIELTEFSNSAPYPQASRSNDVWFQHCAIVVSDMNAAYARVRAFGAEPITREGPQQLPPSAGAVRAFKFRDPDGHPLELLSFPPGSGDPRWQRARGSALMLGIDHSAISVSNVEHSMAFYTQMLGMNVTARQTNHGIEQQRLDALAEVEVDVVALQPTVHTPHIELLGYLRPHGRALNALKARDIAADRIVLQVHDLPGTLESARRANAGFVPHDASAACGEGAALLRDPDGHLLLIEQAPTQA